MNAINQAHSKEYAAAKEHEAAERHYDHWRQFLRNDYSLGCDPTTTQAQVFKSWQRVLDTRDALDKARHETDSLFYKQIQEKKDA